MKAIILLALKDLRLLWRDRFGLFWVLAFPFLMALFFGAIYGDMGGGGSRSEMKVIIVDQDNSEFSRKLADALDKNEGIKIYPRSEDTARTLVRRGRAVAYLIIREGAGEFESVFDADTAYLVAGIDPSRRAEAGYLQGMLMQAWFQVLQQTFLKPDRAQNMVRDMLAELPSDTDLTGEQRDALGGFFGSLEQFLGQVDTGVLARTPVPGTGTAVGADTSAAEEGGAMFSGPRIEFEDIAIEREGPRSSWEITFPQAAIWALIGCAAAFGVSIVIERTRGTLVRLRLAPISRAHILGGKALACFLFCIAVNAALFLFANIVLGVSAVSSWLLVLAVISAAVCFVGIMMLISVMGKTEQAVAGAAWAVLLVIAMTGGGMVPLVVMPSWMRAISNISPAKWSIYAMEGAIWRGLSLGEMLTPLIILWAIGIVTFTAGALILKRMDG
jgi:ABC-2 type transport system permease protein